MNIGLYTPLDPRFLGGMHSWLHAFWGPYCTSRGHRLRVVHAGLVPFSGATSERPLPVEFNLVNVERGLRMPLTGAVLPAVSDVVAALRGCDAVYVDNGYLLQDRVGLAASRAIGAAAISGHHAVIAGTPANALAWAVSGKPRLRKFDAVHALNEIDARRLRAAGARNVLVVPPNVAFDDVIPVRPNKPVIGFLGRLHPQKGIETVLDVFARLRARYGDSIELRIAGDGPLRDIVHAAAARDRIEVLGRIHRAEAKEFLGRCHALFVPSREETFGIVVAEALASGARVIASDIAVFREAFPLPGVTLASDVEGFVRALGAAVENPPGEEEALQISHAAAALFALEPVSKKFDRLLSLAMESKK